MTDGSLWACVPCFAMNPAHAGTLRVHGDTDPDRLTVWCPWCGDAMDPAEEVLTDDELAAVRATEATQE